MDNSSKSYMTKVTRSYVSIRRELLNNYILALENKLKLLNAREEMLKKWLKDSKDHPELYVTCVNCSEVILKTEVEECVMCEGSWICKDGLCESPYEIHSKLEEDIDLSWMY